LEDLDLPAILEHSNLRKALRVKVLVFFHENLLVECLFPNRLDFCAKGIDAPLGSAILIGARR
jgi:hypothetical protein